MSKKIKIFIILIAFILPIANISCAHARPPKPGPNFIWVKAHTKPNGIVIPGHWQHKGSAPAGKTWIKGHYKANGTWVGGHWKKVGPPPRRGAAWIPGHRNARGRWVPGHWR